MDAVLVPNGDVDGESGCLKEYLLADREKTKRFLPGESAVRDSLVFETNVFNITKRLDGFLASKNKEIALLILGKIQSGKTANLLGTVAWAADSRVSLAVIFTGVTEALNLQTEERIKDDLLQLNGQYVKILPVPTSSQGKPFEELLQVVSKWVERRLQNVEFGLNRPLPVLITLKNPSRVKTLKVLVEKLEEIHGQDLTTLLIDDEADQASQNAKARKKDVTATYAAIRALRNMKSRNILLSYTATPQAVLLTERNGRLRPNFCVTVEPRTGYFGLSSAVSSSYTRNRIEVLDWKVKASEMKSAPISLRKALVRFSWTAWLRFNKESLFYAGSGLTTELLGSQLQSLQMLVHESSSQKEHKSVYKLVNDELIALTEALTRAATGQAPRSEVESLYDLWREDLNDLKAGAPIAYYKELDINVDIKFLNQILNLFDDTAIQVVNSDKTKPGRQGLIPVTRTDWQNFRLWILIGGDILGRGLTIPQLTTTYFLRHPPKPNFDTVSQQMRFCGYRSNYSHFTFLFAEGKTFGIFEVMNQIDSAIWRSAKKWDKEHTDIFRDMPVIMYASKPDVKLEPCRKAVHDPDLVDKKIRGEVIFSNKDLMNPVHVKQNLFTLRTFIHESGLTGSLHGDWYLYSDPNDEQMQRILSSWETNLVERSMLVGSAELFFEELEDLGLSDIARNILVHKDLLDNNLNNIDWLLARTEPSRKIAAIDSKVNISNWKSAFVATFQGKLAKISWPHLSVGHVGDGQRAIRKSLSPDATTLMIEPILGHFTKGQPPAVAGIAFTLFTPTGFEIRMIGLGAKLESLGDD